VRVAANDYGDACCGGIDVEIVDGVDEIEGFSGQLDVFGRGEIGAGAIGVYVAANGGDGSDGGKGGENLGSPTSPAWRMWSGPEVG
jgi:hypothetical protein